MTKSNDNKPEPFLSSQEKNLTNPEELKDKTDEQYGYLYWKYTKDLSDSEIILYTFLSTRSAHKSYSYCCNSHIQKFLNWLPRKTERTLQSLEQKKFIYRNSWTITKGAVRHIITFPYAKIYFINILNTSRVPDHIKHDFLQNFLLHHYPDSLFYIVKYQPTNKVMNNLATCTVKNDGSTLTPPVKNDGSLRTVKNDGSTPRKNDGSLKESSKYNRKYPDPSNSQQPTIKGSAQPPERAASPFIILNQQITQILEESLPPNKKKAIISLDHCCLLKSPECDEAMYYSDKDFIKKMKKFLDMIFETGLKELIDGHIINEKNKEKI